MQPLTREFLSDEATWLFTTRPAALTSNLTLTSPCSSSVPSHLDSSPRCCDATPSMLPCESRATCGATTGGGGGVTGGVTTAGSTFAGVTFGGSVFAGSVFATTAFTGSVFAGVTFGGSVFAGSVFATTAFAGSVFAGSVFAGSVFVTTAFAGSASAGTDAGSAAAGSASSPTSPSSGEPAIPSATPDELRKICADAMNANPGFADKIVSTINEQTAKQHRDASAAIAKNEKHVLLAYAAMWLLAAGFLMFMWRRQQGLNKEIAQLKRDLEAATKS